MTVGGPSQ